MEMQGLFSVHVICSGSRGPMGLGNLTSILRHFGSFHYLLVQTYKQMLYMDLRLHCIVLCITIIFECQRYLWIKEEKLLKVWAVSSILEVSSTFWENTGHFSIGNWARNSAPKTALNLIPEMWHQNHRVIWQIEVFYLPKVTIPVIDQLLLWNKKLSI